MLTVEEALKAVIEHARPLAPRRVPLAEALGCLLAEDVAADMDSPPFDKALVDGFAVRAADCAGDPPFRLSPGEEIPAGRTPARPLAPGEAASIMTGAPLPSGADGVVMVEHSRRDGSAVILNPRSPIRPGQNRLERGREMRMGDRVLCGDTWLTAAKLAVLAGVGCVSPLVRPRALVRIVPTGDELVEADQTPGPGQIRNTNAVLLKALVDSRGDIARAEVGAIAPDEPRQLRERLAHGLGADVLLITGGVSAGNRDLVPESLASHGVRTVFHKVRLKPGKPILFGIGPDRPDGQPGALVFGLPGNPVSALVGFLLFVGPALNRLRGRGFDGLDEGEAPERFPLARPFSHRGDRPTYHPAEAVIVNPGDERASLVPLDWAGSPDLRTVAAADGFAIFPAGDHDYAAGEEVEFLPLVG